MVADVGRLDLLGKQIQKANEENLTGLTRLAPTVCAVLDAWNAKDADGATPNQWLSRWMGRCRNGNAKGGHVRTFRTLKAASKRLGRMAATRFSSTALIYLHNQLSDEQWEAVKMSLQTEARRSGGILNDVQVRRSVATLLNFEPKSQACQGCVQLMDRVRRLEKSIVEQGGVVP